MWKCFTSFYILVFLCFYKVLGNDEDHESLYSLVTPHHHYPTPRLEDFFWTGSGDGPPPPEDTVDPTAIQPAVVVTTTVMATVFLDSYPGQSVTDKTTGECVDNCGEPVDPGSLQPEISEDRRYWLLTVIQGSTPDNLQLRLAKLYQKAFLRQQERHLGIIKSLDSPTPRKKHDVNSFNITSDNNVPYTDTNAQKNHSTSNNNNSNKNSETKHKRKAKLYLANIDSNNNNDVEIEISENNKIEEKTWVLVNPNRVIKKREVTEAFEVEELRGTGSKEEIIDLLDDEIGNGSVLSKREIIKPDQQPPVYVHIQNVTETPLTGTVEIIYIVLVNGRAVPAVVAARDMRLVRDAEVAGELNAQLTTKAEPYLKAAEGLAGEEIAPGIQGSELWALSIGSAIAVILLLLLLALVCRLFSKKKAHSAASHRAYRDELIREVERNQLRQVHEEKDGKLISVVSPSRTRPSSTLLPVYRASSASSTSTSSSGVSMIATSTYRRKQKKPHALRMPQKKRETCARATRLLSSTVGTTDSLLQSVADSSDSCKEISVPATPTSYLSMPSLKSFPRGNLVEPLSKVLEPISVRHLDIESSDDTSKGTQQLGERAQDVVPRRQMASQLVRLGSMDKDPGVIGPMVWDLHCQRVRDAPPKTASPARSSLSLSSTYKEPSISKMRQRFNELVDDAFSLFGSPSHGIGVAKANSNADGSGFGIKPSVVFVEEKDDFKQDINDIAQARNDNVRLPGSPYTALDTVRGRSANNRMSGTIKVVDSTDSLRPRTSFPRAMLDKRIPTRAWDTAHPSTSTQMPPQPRVNPAFILAEGRLNPEDPALPLISAIKSEIQRVRESAEKH